MASLIVSLVRGFIFQLVLVAPLVRMVASSSFNPAFKSDICLVSQSGTSNGDCARPARVFLSCFDSERKGLGSCHKRENR